LVGPFVVWGAYPPAQERLAIVAANMELPKVVHWAGAHVYLVSSLSPKALCQHLDPSDRTPQHFAEIIRNKGNRVHHKGYRAEMYAPVAKPPVGTPVLDQAVTALACVVKPPDEGPVSALVELARRSGSASTLD
jgi:hypothetical protein